MRVDDRLLKGEAAAQGERALKLLGARLVAISNVVPEPALAKLRTVTIQLDLDYGKLRAMQLSPERRLAEGKRLKRIAREVRPHSLRGGFSLAV